MMIAISDFSNEALVHTVLTSFRASFKGPLSKLLCTAVCSYGHGGQKVKGAKPRSQALGPAFKLHEKSLQQNLRGDAASGKGRKGKQALLSHDSENDGSRVESTESLAHQQLALQQDQTMVAMGGVATEVFGSPPKELLSWKRDIVSPAKGSPLTPGKEARLGVAPRKSKLPPGLSEKVF